ncbi:SGNH/GDSL hydrolase family protein [Arthrobacter psychrolactophilus]|nr:SGNH/GDSL hydrolase family protein [Arthrobacter psychrolactophilus]
MKRYIRLKELPPSTERFHTPSEEQIECSDSSLVVEPYICRVDDQGFMKTGFEGGSHLQPIVIMGDSFVESMYSAEELRFVSQVERNLNEDSEKYRFLNAGYSGSTSLQLLNSLINKVYPTVGPGSTIVFFAPHSDRDNLYKDGSYWNGSQRGAALLPASGVGNPQLVHEIEAFSSVLTLLAAASKALQLNLILGTAPFRVADFASDAPLRRLYRRSRENYELGLQRRRAFCAEVRNFSRENNLPLIDGEIALAGDASYFYDELHLNSTGHEKFAEFVSPELAKHLS